MRKLSLSGLLVLATACASTPRPAILSEVDAIRGGSTAKEARELVPQADARAEKLRRDAEAAWPKGQTATAEMAAERAIVAYADARELARIVKAEKRLLAAKAEAHQAELAVQKLEADQKKAAAESADLDAQLRILREAESIAILKPSLPERERARMVAAKTAVAQARLLCVSAKLLRNTAQPNTAIADIDAAMKDLTALSEKLAPNARGPAPIREAITSRSRCQQLLTDARRPTTMANPVSEKPDQLFVELARAGFSPSRDDRGIVVTLFAPFQGPGLEQSALAKLAELGGLAQRFDPIPLLIVTHSTKGDPTAADQQRGDAAASKLRASGVKQTYVQAIGGRLPIADARELAQPRRNERLEVVFVTAL
ncbi:MAG TPA: hypothetical protein VKP30_22125 [Polyangiaceae bacterium]|nr:hypothetical protein [Polyangiaceae bacterium]